MVQRVGAWLRQPAVRSFPPLPPPQLCAVPAPLGADPSRALPRAAARGRCCRADLSSVLALTLCTLARL